MKTAFQFDPRTGDYIGQVEVARDDDAMALALAADVDKALAAPRDVVAAMDEGEERDAALAELAKLEKKVEADARKNQVDIWLLPEDATFTVLPAIPKGHGAKWTGEAWVTMPDHRGEVWYDADGMGYMLYHLGHEKNFEFPLTPTKPKAAADRQAAEAVRAERDARLADSDVLVLPDRWEAYTDARRKAVAAYRDALRNVTGQKGFPHNVTWPRLDS